MIKLNLLFIFLTLAFSLNGQELKLDVVHDNRSFEYNNKKEILITNRAPDSLDIESELDVYPSENFISYSDTMLPMMLNSLQNTFVESNLCLSFGGDTKISLSGIGLEVGLLQRFKTQSNHFISLSGGFERLTTLLSTYSLPLMIGYQYNVDKDVKFKPIFFGKIGHGFEYLADDKINSWETLSVNGGERYEIGIGLIKNLGNHIAWSLKTSFISQKINFDIKNEWSQTHSEQVINRIFIKLGVLF